MKIEWDPLKAEANLKRHGVRFSEAVAVLGDEFAISREDPDAIGEQRLVTLGLSADGILLVVVSTDREPDTVRIISAWRANQRQRLEYEKGRC